MPSWVRRVARRFRSDGPSAAPLSAPPAAPVPVPAVEARPPDRDSALLDWLLDLPAADVADVAAGLTPREADWLSAMDVLIATDGHRADLLPMAAGIIPPLLASLRDEGQTAQSTAAQLARDSHLVAEVMRRANSAAAQGSRPPSSLTEAVQRIGTVGVRQSIARVVLKPMFAPQRGPLTRTSTERLWQHASALSEHCVALAPARQVDGFDACLGGLLHNTGWLAGLRALERAFGDHPPPQPHPFSEAFKAAFAQRRHRLFAAFVTDWQLTPGLLAAARAVREAHGFEHAKDALANVLWHGNLRACDDVLTAAGRPAAPRPDDPSPGPATTPAIPSADAA